MGIVRLTQHLRPNGDRRPVNVEQPDDVVEMAKRQILSCEMMPDGSVALYARKSEWEEEDEQVELAVNGPGEKSPKNTLERLIRMVNQMERPEGE